LANRKILSIFTNDMNLCIVLLGANVEFTVILHIQQYFKIVFVYKFWPHNEQRLNIRNKHWKISGSITVATENTFKNESIYNLPWIFQSFYTLFAILYFNYTSHTQMAYSLFKRIDQQLKNQKPGDASLLLFVFGSNFKTQKETYIIVILRNTLINGCINDKQSR
jgi:hypothetical protein